MSDCNHAAVLTVSRLGRFEAIETIGAGSRVGAESGRGLINHDWCSGNTEEEQALSSVEHEEQRLAPKLVPTIKSGGYTIEKSMHVTVVTRASGEFHKLQVVFISPYCTVRKIILSYLRYVQRRPASPPLQRLHAPTRARGRTLSRPLQDRGRAHMDTGAAATSSEHQTAATDEQWHELQLYDRWTVNAAVAAAARANPPSTQRHDRRALRWRPHEPHELEAMSAWADLQAAETSLAVAHKVKRGRCQMQESSSPIRKRNRWTAMVAATELAFGQQCVIST
jgi:hypothetical protein